jgi:hypothetical protein
MYWVFILAGPLILFTWIRSFRYLAFTSIIGTHTRTRTQPIDDVCPVHSLTAATSICTTQQQATLR